MERIPRLAANGSWLDDILGFAKGKKDQRKGTNAGLPEVRRGRANGPETSDGPLFCIIGGAVTHF